MNTSLHTELQSESAMVQWISGLVAQARQLSPEEIDPNKPFVELGLDSMSAVSLSGDLEMMLGVDLPPTLLWEYPTINALVSYVWPLWKTRQTASSFA